jgi:hypothetical protein
MNEANKVKMRFKKRLFEKILFGLISTSVSQARRIYCTHHTCHFSKMEDIWKYLRMKAQK